MNILAEYWDRFRSSLFPRLETVLEEPLTEKLQQFVRVLDIVRIEQFVASPHLQWMGRKALDRRLRTFDTENAEWRFTSQLGAHLRNSAQLGL